MNATTSIANDRIEKTIEIKAPISRVWKALTDHEQFGTWFMCRIDGPFVVGQLSTGNTTYPGYEYIKWEVMVQKMEPPRFFSYTWHPCSIERGKDYSDETPTLVEFTLEETKTGTRLTVVESGFSKIPAYRRDEAFRMNTAGWSTQVENIRRYVEQKT